MRKDNRNIVLYIVDNYNWTVFVMRVMYGGCDIDVQLDKYTKFEEQCKSVFEVEMWHQARNT